MEPFPWRDLVLAKDPEPSSRSLPDAEKALGLPVSMNCDRESVNVNKCQVGFITFLVSPIWKGIAQLIPAQGPQLLAELDANLEHYKALAA